MGVTAGLVLLRQPYREYDEKILFYTEALGKIWAYAFGSRSPRSLRGQRLAEIGWLDLEFQKKGSYYLLQDLHPRPIPDYHRNQAYFLGWTEFLKNLSDKIPGGVPTPEIFSLLVFLSGPEPGKWSQNFREFTWMFSVLKELGLLPDFSRCQSCREYCSNYYYFSFPGEVVGSECIPKLKNFERNYKFSDELPNLALEDVYFLNYCRENYSREEGFFIQAFALAEKLSESFSDALPSLSKEPSHVLYDNHDGKLAIHWDRILPVLRAVLKY